MASGATTAAGSTRTSATTPTSVAPPRPYAYTASTTVTAHSAVQAPKNAACARRRSGLRQFVAKAAVAACRRDGCPCAVASGAIVEG